MPTIMKGRSGASSRRFTSARSRTPMLIEPMQSRMTIIGITNVSGKRCARSGTAMRVEPKPEMPKITYAASTISGANTSTSGGGIVIVVEASIQPRLRRAGSVSFESRNLQRREKSLVQRGRGDKIARHHSIFPPMTELLLIRHGETLWNQQGRMQGQHDSPLTALGLQQARQLASRLKDVAFAALYA